MRHLADLLDHLATYKRDTLAVRENGTFFGREYPHILPPKRGRLNILPRFRDQFYASSHSRIRFHQFFHHLNSSQALCVNLFYPLVARHQLQLLTRYVGIETDSYPTPTFEKLSEIENSKRRRTNFDFHLRYPEGQEIFVEVKYTERQFGRAADDAEHREKFDRTYAPLLRNSTYLVDKCHDRTFFLANYQVLRNLIHAGPKARILFLLPSAKFSIANDLVKSVEKLLTDSGKALVQVIFLDDLVTYFTSRCDDRVLVEYYQAFREKYLPSVVFSHTASQETHRK